MKPTKLVFSFCLMFAIVSANADETTPAYGIRSKDPSITAFTNATIQISPVQVIEKGTLVIRNGLIESVGQNAKIPADATVIDLAGKFIYPGFIDPFTEYGLAKEEKTAGRRTRGDSAPKYEANREGGGLVDGVEESLVGRKRDPGGIRLPRQEVPKARGNVRDGDAPPRHLRHSGPVEEDGGERGQPDLDP